VTLNFGFHWQRWLEGRPMRHL